MFISVLPPTLGILMNCNIEIDTVYILLPPPLFAASIRAVWNTEVGQGLGTQLSESPITENTMVGVDLMSSLVELCSSSV